MIKKPRVRILMMPYQDDDDKDPTGYAGPATVLTGLPRTIRRQELRLIVPLADSTIYEMHPSVRAAASPLPWRHGSIGGWSDRR